MDSDVPEVFLRRNVYLVQGGHAQTQTLPPVPPPSLSFTSAQAIKMKKQHSISIQNIIESGEQKESAAALRTDRILS